MRPPTPAMIRLLREIEQQPVTMNCVDRETVIALFARGLAVIPGREAFLPYEQKTWHITDAGRRVLAEHTTTGDE